MRKKFVSTCSPNKLSLHSVYRQEIPWRLFLLTAYVPMRVARRGGVEVAGWTVDRKTQVRFPAYPHRVWAIWWQGG